MGALAVYRIGMKKLNLSVDDGQSVDEYIAQSPPEIRETLNRIRAAIKEVAPDSFETTSYFKMPGYFYKGYDYNGMFAWFSYKRPYVRLHVRPPVIQNHMAELADYDTTKAIVSFPEEGEVPLDLIKSLVRASMRAMKAKSE